MAVIHLFSSRPVDKKSEKADVQN